MAIPDLAWIILFLPLLSAVVITLFLQRDARFSAQVSIAAVAVSFVLSVVVFITLSETSHASQGLQSSSFTWLAVGDFTVEFGLRLDPLSLLMMLVVTGVGGAIHVYSAGYMSGERGFYFAGLSVFTFAMLGIVL